MLDFIAKQRQYGLTLKSVIQNSSIIQEEKKIIYQLHHSQTKQPFLLPISSFLFQFLIDILYKYEVSSTQGNKTCL